MEEATFRDIKEVLEFLQSDFRVRKSTLYVHLKEGRLRAVDGAFREKDVSKYGKLFLKRHDSATPQPVSIEKLQSRKIESEARKLEAQAKHWEMRAEVESGRYVRRDQFELELAGHAAIFKDGIEYFCRTEAVGIIRLLNGDLSKAPALTEYLLEKTASWLDTYSVQGKEWEVIFDAPEPTENNESKEDDLESKDEEDAEDD